MEYLKYIVEDRTIVELLGVQNFTNKESAVLELVKNAYDAKAPEVIIRFVDKKLHIIDNGNGMSEQDIRKHWMHVGKSQKGYSIVNKATKESRVLAGSKGIGRFALARLGSHVEVYSHKQGYPPIQWKTDWDQSTIDTLDRNIEIGTQIIISELSDKWTPVSIKKLQNSLSVAYNDTKMKIQIFSEASNYTVVPYYLDPKIGVNFVSSINMTYNCKSKILTCKIHSDEFQQSAEKYYPKDKLTYLEQKLNMYEELSSDREIESSGDDLYALLEKLGGFSAEFYFSFKSSTDHDVESFLYKHSSLPARYEKGVALYRNAFSISSFEGKKDWIGFGKRSRKSPAAATHTTGSWRVRENQISGKVVIDKKKNKMLRDLSNRQGLDENDYYEVFIKIIDAGISVFERYRQDIIRAINTKNKILEENSTIIEQILKNPKHLAALTSNETKALVRDIVNIQKTAAAYKDQKETTEEKYRYDVRILNVFATSGLKATSIAHELKNDRNNIKSNYKYIIDALKKFDLWDELNSPENTEKAYENVPQMLEQNNAINRKLLIFMDTMLDETTKSRFEPRNLLVKNVMDSIKSKWERDYAFISIKNEIEEDMVYYTAEDIFTVIFDNLILNSIEQNDSRSDLSINIFSELRNGKIYFSYHDNGRGLVAKYLNDPMRILVVHESSRKDGHGLGMWIVNNTAVLTGGSILRIDGHDGFTIEFELGVRV